MRKTTFDLFCRPYTDLTNILMEKRINLLQTTTITKVIVVIHTGQAKNREFKILTTDYEYGQIWNTIWTTKYESFPSKSLYAPNTKL